MKHLGSFDYVIVGAGSAGCVLANRLSEDPGARVALLEAGGSDNYIWIRIPVGYLYCMGNPRTDWGLTTDPEPGLNGRTLNYPRGRVLGGCSSINGMIYCAARPATTIIGASWATPAGAGRMRSATSSSPRTRPPCPETNFAAPAASGASRPSA